ncbi:hypothetical protein Agub_g3621 [Astrephomene gubernaculifera]|uniref:Uncharacterized protein n=1 Tax=Astrephomene gubernaculifera TaxID=47775 RepID=A0AAD3DK90_9CHLO|nr:hypothetical protein Agub_g3621 [Astrephomene gubernaculifera]
MATKVKSKIQRLLKQLDQDDDGGAGIDTILQPTTSEDVADDLSVLAATRRAAAAISSTPGSSSTMGASESAGAYTGFTNSESLLPHEDDSESIGPSCSSLDTTPCHQASRPPPGKHHFSTAANAERVAVLERKVMALMAENRNLQAAFSEAMSRKNAEVAELQSHLAGTVRELSARQQELEAAAPLLALRLEGWRGQLAELRLSDAAAAELRGLPREARTPLDEVRLAVHDALLDSRAETERLRTALAAAREAAARAEEAAARSRHEAARGAATLSEREKDLALVTEGMQARIDRLASELEGALVAAQLGAAKGAMYDELRSKLDAAVAENQRLAVVEATYKKLEAQAAQDRASASQKEHTFEMLMMDKAYLSKQVDFLTDQQRKTEAELELREKKINELSRHKTELFEKLMAAEALKGRHEEARLQKELAALQERTHADLEKIRVETADAYEREARLLRELRDGAAQDASRAKAALAELQALHEKTCLAHAEVTRRLEQQVVSLQTELKQRSFELSHFKVVVAEKEQLVGRTNMQNELLQDKLAVLMDKYRALEVEHNSHVNRALAAAAAAVAASGGQTRGSAAAAQEGGGAAAAAAAGGEGGSGAATTKLHVELALLKQERDSLAREVELLQGRLAAAQDSLRLAAQPHAFLIEELEAIKQRATQAETKAAALQVALTARNQEHDALKAERDALRGDLDGLLAQRAALEGMRAVVVRALAGGLPQVQQAAALAASSRRPPPPLSTTTILGEGCEAAAAAAPPLQLQQAPAQQ